MRRKNTSWQNVSGWYSEKVGQTGHYFHEQVILPNLIAIMDLDENSTILDLACGEGVLARTMPKFKGYLGIDLSRSLIEEAKKKTYLDKMIYQVGDVSKKLEVVNAPYSHCTIVLALQNIENYIQVFKNAYSALEKNGKFYIVLNHPYFRIPKSSSWEMDKETGYQYRKISRYFSEHKIRIDMTPGQEKNKEITYSFHRSLHDIVGGLKQSGFVVSDILEWVSNKKSVGKFADSENFARDEFPMFMCIECTKLK
jgi:ubiquinone/menaquinone biosynthesis C-methylase UbiE